MKTYILHLETATRVCSVGLSCDGELLALHETEEEGYVHGERLNLFIQEVMKSVGITMKDLAAVSLASGPGSYTGLRIGAATAKGLCYALDIPLVAVDALSSLVALAREKHGQQRICAVIDARRMEVYNLLADENGTPLKEISADIIDENSYLEFEPFVCVGDGTTKLQELWANRKVMMDADLKSSARGQVELAYARYRSGSFEDVAYWEPFYLKDFIAGSPKSSGI